MGRSVNYKDHHHLKKRERVEALFGGHKKNDIHGYQDYAQRFLTTLILGAKVSDYTNFEHHKFQICQCYRLKASTLNIIKTFKCFKTL